MFFSLLFASFFVLTAIIDFRSSFNAIRFARGILAVFLAVIIVLTRVTGV